LAAPWIRGGPLRRLVSAARTGIVSRVLFRVKDPEDLQITDVAALLELERRGARLRYSKRLHAKIIIADGCRAIVSSSNLTEAAGFGGYEAHRRNREMGLLVDGDDKVLRDIVAGFEAAWEEGD
jgi:phosphatidylserine/phosphatidylglycerophosphate/cardiolipin synthase-like enzyme